MNPQRPTNRRTAACLLLLLGILILGIVQWSFLPILIQNGPVASSAALEISASHSSKFAAPFKCLFGDALRPCLIQSKISVPKIVVGIPHPTENPFFGNDDFFLSYHPLRAPPTA
jgi:hypothetical protein